VSDISMTNLNGLVTMLGLWLMAGGYFIAAVAFCVASLRTGRRTLYGPRLGGSALLGVALVVGSFQLGRLPARLLDQLDASLPFWIAPAFASSLFACFKLGKKV
jgi:hypothetical protein